jgi:septal ring-binding cell division protein DamX
MATREPELYKDKIEVSLDGRQIFYLFFGGAVIVGLVFVLGVTVGRRVEARGHVEHARTTAAEDPLAALDRLEANGGLTFKGALTGAQPASQVEQKVAAIEKEKKDEKKEDKKVEKPVEKKPEPEKKVEKVEKAEDKKPEPVEKKPEPEKKADVDKKADKPPKNDEQPSSKFTLQLSSFQDKKEADAFLGTIKAAGYAAYITEADVSGKTFYRVRLGNYRTLEAANDAKVDVEKTLKKTATVMKL